MKVIEIFEAFQGEGQFIGQPSTFVRFFGCNMHCSWCDTAYAINRKELRSSEPIQDLTVEQLMEEVTSKPAGFIVLTGGEPTIQPQLVQLLQELYSVGYLTTIETNASIIPDGLKEWYGESWSKSDVLWSLSPKLPSAHVGSAGRAWIDRAVIQWFVAQTRSQLKFVIADRIDLLGALRLVRSLQFEPLCVPIIFQPEGSIVDQGVDQYLCRLKSLQRELDPGWANCDVRVLPQLHILLHGRKKRRV